MHLWVGKLFNYVKNKITKKHIIIVSLILVLLLGGVFFYAFFGKSKKMIAIQSIAAVSKIAQMLPIKEDTKKELQAVEKLTEEFTQSDNKEKRFLVLLQNTMELRPGGGFLGQYAIIKMKNGEVTSTFVEDANLLDERIGARITPPYPFKAMMQIKKWKLRDSNFSPDFPTNAEKAKYFLRLAGTNNDFDGVIAINSDVLNDVLELTGPVQVPGYSTTFTSEEAVLQLEDIVERPYLQNPDLDTRYRKEILKKMANVIIEELFKLNNISKIAGFAHTQMQNKNIMLNFKDPALQNVVADVHWDGAVAAEWQGDYLMAVDANMGALKTDHYMRREITYDIDLTQERPLVTVNILYKNTAPYGNWRTSDYHSYLRVYAPKGAEFLERKMVGFPFEGEEFGKKYFGVKVDVLIGRETNAMLKYQLPADFNKEDYKLLIQKQSGVGDVPIKVHVKSAEGELNYADTLKKDLKLELQKD